jgi:hypothetical protein
MIVYCNHVTGMIVSRGMVDTQALLVSATMLNREHFLAPYFVFTSMVHYVDNMKAMLVVL